MILPPPISTLFPYTTLFRSVIVVSRVGLFDEKRKLLQTTTPQDGSEARFACGTKFRTFCATVLSPVRSEEHTSELQSRRDLVCRLLLEKKKKNKKYTNKNK